jgi:hypothetical protein
MPCDTRAQQWLPPLRSPGPIVCSDAKPSSRCDHYTLPCGEPFVAVYSPVAEVSSRWLPLLPINGAALDDENALVRLMPAFDRQHPPPFRVTHVNETAAWIRCGKQQARFGPAQDARGIWFNGRLLVFYARPVDATVRFLSVCRACKVAWYMRDLSDHPDREVMLQVPPGTRDSSRRFLNWEKNWMPIVADSGVGGAALYLSYSLQPHIVLQCDRSTGVCSVVHNTSAPDTWRHAGFMRGSSPVLQHKPSGRMIGVAHTRRRDVYRHVFYELQPTLPFRVISTSHAWRFAACHGDEEKVQFVAGAYFSGVQQETLVLSYGASDRNSMVVTVRVEDVFRLLAGQLPSVEWYPEQKMRRWETNRYDVFEAMQEKRRRVNARGYRSR